MLYLSLRITAVSIVVLSLVGCSCSDAPKTQPLAYCNVDKDCKDGTICIDHKCKAEEVPDGSVPLNDGEVDYSLKSIRIDPETATLTSVNGTKPKQTFTVYAKYDTDEEFEIPGVNFEIEPLSLGTIDPSNGEFKANGIIAGEAQITAEVTAGGKKFAAVATVKVRIERTVKGDGVPDDVADKFTNTTTDADLAAQIVYPLDGAVMPQNVYPVDLQWNRGAEDDLFRITIAKENVSVVTYVKHDGDGFNNHWLFDDLSWRTIAQSDPDLNATIIVDRWDSASMVAVTTPPVSVRFARAAITGSVYYWDIQAGRSIRIDDGTAERVSYMPNPPKAYPASPYKCIGCHSVSPSGRYIAAELGVFNADFDTFQAIGNGTFRGAVVYDLTSDLTGDPPPVAFSSGMIKYNWFFSTWSPDESRILASQDLLISGDFPGDGPLRLFDRASGEPVAATGLGPTDNATHPAWSPDGTKVAYVSGKSNNIFLPQGAEWGGTNTTGNISMIDVTGTDAFGNNRLILAGNSPTIVGSVTNGDAASYPTWSADSEKIAFAHGTGSRSDTENSTLYIMNPDGTNVVRLANAAPGNNNFQPRFSPFQQGGYYWMSFLSRRDYGNTAIGTQGTQFQQIWVTAVSDHAADGEDPSSVPYWVPGQDVKSRNISAFWAPRPCRVDGEGCTVGSECCGGDCRPDANDVLVCSPPPPDRCREYNETCSTSNDCCEGYTCSNNVCIVPVM